MNLITGVIVENVLMIFRQDEIKKELKERQHRRDMTVKLHDLFMDSDVDGDFQLSFEEFCAMLENDTVTKYLFKMKILADDLRELFDIMDVDGSGRMDIREFFDCFNNVKGHAQSKHLLHLHQKCIGDFRKNEWGTGFKLQC